MSLREWLIKKLGGCTRDFHISAMHKAVGAAYEKGKQQARIQFSVLPLPFTPNQLVGKEYGTFITPAGFAHTFGECNVPAPGPFGYAQYAGYVPKQADMGDGFRVAASVDEDDRDRYVPVIVTVLR